MRIFKRANQLGKNFIQFQLDDSEVFRAAEKDLDRRDFLDYWHRSSAALVHSHLWSNSAPTPEDVIVLRSALFEKALLVSTALQRAWQWACCPHKLCPALTWMQTHLYHHLSGTRRGKLSYAHLTTSHRRSLLSSITPWKTGRLWDRKVWAALPETSNQQRKLKKTKKVLYFTVACQ